MDKSRWPRPEGSECGVCGAHAIVVTDDPIADVVEGATYYATGITYNRCTACHEEFIAGFQQEEINAQLFAQAREALGRLSGEDIRSIRLGLGLTQGQLEGRLGASKGIVGRWERSDLMQSAMADRYLRDLMAHPELVDSQGVIAREGRGPYKTRKK
jgi:putative zinc finger/helix-turn-helix YgiT family protein